MNDTLFDGQQEGERILYTVHEHPLSAYISYVTISVISLCIFGFTGLISTTFPDASTIIWSIGVIFGIGVLALGALWTKRHHEQSVAYITDRRIMRFEAVSPFFVAERALFLNEARKAKAVTKNVFCKILNIGMVVVETQVPDQGEVRLGNVYYYDDLVNYIDKILYLFKNTPSEISGLRPFVPKPKGKRD